jgi:hypothetical protein
MELTITQNGALFAIHRGASRQSLGMQRERAVACEKIPGGPARPENSAAQKVKTEEICFISSGT